MSEFTQVLPSALLQDEKAEASRAGHVSIVIFGASGDLTQRKLVPALHSLSCGGLMPDRFTVLGVSRTPLTDDEFRAQLREGVVEHGRQKPDECGSWDDFACRFHYQAIDYSDPASYQQIGAWLEEMEQTTGCGNCLFYLATPPTLYETIVAQLGNAALAEREGFWRRIVVEKPFGHDLASARRLNQPDSPRFR